MNTKQFFYVDGGTQKGPVSIGELVGKITPDTDVWCEGMPNWAKASTVPELSALLGGGAQPMSDAQYASQYGSANDYIGNSQNYGNPQPIPEPNFGNPQPDPVNQQTFGNVQQNTFNSQNVPAGEKPNNYLIWAIVVTVVGACWCLPMITGIISIVFAVNVDKEWMRGNAEEARKAADKAKLFIIISAALIAIIFVINMFSGFASTLLNNIR